MATVAQPEVRHESTILRRVPYKVYAQLSDAPENRHLRMAYNDGTLYIMSPVSDEHEEPSRQLSIIVTTVAEAIGLEYHGTGSRTFRRGGEGIYKGKGSEPDQSFFIASVGRLPKGRRIDLDAGDPPPDLWIEVDHESSSFKRLPIYAALGVPEVWRFRTESKSLKFLRLDNGEYRRLDRSLSLPGLTPALALEALALGEGVLESEFVRRLRPWAAGKFGRGGGEG